MTYSLPCELDGGTDYWNEAEREWYRREKGVYVKHEHPLDTVRHPH